MLKPASQSQNTWWTLYTPPFNSFPSYNLRCFTICSLGLLCPGLYYSILAVWRAGGVLPRSTGWEPLGAPTNTASTATDDIVGIITTIKYSSSTMH